MKKDEFKRPGDYYESYKTLIWSPKPLAVLFLIVGLVILL